MMMMLILVVNEYVGYKELYIRYRCTMHYAGSTVVVCEWEPTGQLQSDLPLHPPWSYQLNAGFTLIFKASKCSTCLPCSPGLPQMPPGHSGPDPPPIYSHLIFTINASIPIYHVGRPPSHPSPHKGFSSASARDSHWEIVGKNTLNKKLKLKFGCFATHLA